MYIFFIYFRLLLFIRPEKKNVVFVFNKFVFYLYFYTISLTGFLSYLKNTKIDL